MFPYIGSKRNEIKEIIKVLPDNIENYEIYEPFGGSCAFSQYMNLKHGNTIHINDVSAYCYLLYEKIKHNDLAELCNNALNHFNKIKEINCLALRKDIEKEKEKPITKDNIHKIYLYSKLMRGHMVRDKHPKDITKALNKIIKDNDKLNREKVNIYNLDYKIFLESIKDDGNSVIYLDPPYFDNVNCRLDDKECTTGSREFTADDMIYLFEFFKTSKNKVILNVNGLGLYKYIFKGYKSHEYSKMYAATKRKGSHILYINEKINE